MLISFNAALPPKDKGRHQMLIPINIWEATHKKWVGKIKVVIEGKEYMCHILERGDGFYSFLIVRDMVRDLGVGRIVKITVELINSIEVLKSPYSFEKPIRKIDNLIFIKQPTCYTCGQACIAMLANVSVEEVCKVMGTDQNTRYEHHYAALDYYGLKHSTKYKPLINKLNFKLPDICILNIKMPTYGHSIVYYYGKYYDPEFGLLESCHPKGIISTFLEIYQ